MKRRIILIVFVVALLFIGLLVFIRINNNYTGGDYNKLISKGIYLNDIEYPIAIDEVSFRTLDFDKDGEEELVLYLSDGSGYGVTMFYTKNKKKIKYLDQIYLWGHLYYNTSDNTIMYMDKHLFNTNEIAYGVYEFKNNKHVLVKTLIAEKNDDKVKYYLAANNQKNEISETEYNGYFANYVALDLNYKTVN